jgi:signal peptidase I
MSTGLWCGAAAISTASSQWQAGAWLVGLAVLIVGTYGAVGALAHRAARRATARGSVVVSLAFLLVAMCVSELSTGVGLLRSKAYRQSGGSMQPTLSIGDHFLVDRLPYGGPLTIPSLGITLARLPAARPPRRGDIVVHHPPRGRDDEYVKRIVALAGETVHARGETLRVNDQAVPEPYAVYVNGGVTGPRDYAVSSPFLVPADHVFVLGDNRDASADSRHYGPVPVSDVTGVATTIYWSWDAQGSVDWRRIGRTLQTRGSSE